MKNYAKVGNRRGRPAYRTPASFRYRAHIKNLRCRAMEAVPRARTKKEREKRQDVSP